MGQRQLMKKKKRYVFAKVAKGSEEQSLTLDCRIMMERFYSVKVCIDKAFIDIRGRKYRLLMSRLCANFNIHSPAQKTTHFEFY
jgi:hypothetical protein